MIAAAGAAAALAAAGVFVLGDGAGPADGIVTAIHPDGRVEWADARFVKAAEENGRIAERVPGTAHQAVLAGDVQIFTGVGSWCASAAAGLATGSDGAGANPCTRAEFLATTPDSLYAVKITVKGDVVTRIAEYYHP
jgi:hypothetical protein